MEFFLTFILLTQKKKYVSFVNAYMGGKLKVENKEVHSRERELR